MNENSITPYSSWIEATSESFFAVMEISEEEYSKLYSIYEENPEVSANQFVEKARKIIQRDYYHYIVILNRIERDYLYKQHLEAIRNNDFLNIRLTSFKMISMEVFCVGGSAAKTVQTIYYEGFKFVVNFQQFLKYLNNRIRMPEEVAKLLYQRLKDFSEKFDL